MGDTQFHFRIRCSPRSCHKSRLVSQYENEVPLSYRVCVVDPYCKTTVPRSYRAVKKFLSRRLVMNSRQLWNPHQRHKFLRAEACQGHFEIQSLRNGIFGGIQEVFSTVDAMFFLRIHARPGIMPSKCPRFEHFTDLNLFECAFNCNVIQNWETDALQLYSMVLIFCQQLWQKEMKVAG